MAKIELFEDQTRMGTYSQIRLDDGKRVLISLTQTEVMFKKVVFGIPMINIMGAIDINLVLDLVYPFDSKSKNADESLLKIVTEIALKSGGSIKELDDMFSKNLVEYNSKIKAEGERS